MASNFYRRVGHERQGVEDDALFIVLQNDQELVKLSSRNHYRFNLSFAGLLEKLAINYPVTIGTETFESKAGLLSDERSLDISYSDYYEYFQGICAKADLPMEKAFSGVVSISRNLRGYGHSQIGMTEFFFEWQKGYLGMRDMIALQKLFEHRPFLNRMTKAFTVVKLQTIRLANEAANATRIAAEAEQQISEYTTLTNLPVITSKPSPEPVISLFLTKPAQPQIQSLSSDISAATETIAPSAIKKLVSRSAQMRLWPPLPKPKQGLRSVCDATEIG